MTTSYWLENHHEPGKHVLVDLGYLKYQASMDRCDQLLEHIGKKNVELHGAGRRDMRLMIRIPPTKVEKVLTLFPDIKSREQGGGGYVWCTHFWNEGAKEL